MDTLESSPGVFLLFAGLSRRSIVGSSGGGGSWGEGGVVAECTVPGSCTTGGALADAVGKGGKGGALASAELVADGEGPASDTSGLEGQPRPSKESKPITKCVRIVHLKGASGAYHTSRQLKIEMGASPDEPLVASSPAIALSLLAMSTSKKATAAGTKASTAASTKKSAAPAKKPSTKATAKTTTTEAPAALKVGQSAPAFSVVADDGKTLSLADFKGKRVVLYFYPKDNTPGCTREACSFQDNLAKLASKNALVIGVSRDSAKSHSGFKTKYKLAFPLLVDADAALHRAYGAWGTKTMYGKTIEGALRTTVIIDENGKVGAIFNQVKVDGHTDAVLAALDAIQ